MTIIERSNIHLKYTYPKIIIIIIKNTYPKKYWAIVKLSLKGVFLLNSIAQLMKLIYTQKLSEFYWLVLHIQTPFKYCFQLSLLGLSWRMGPAGVPEYAFVTLHPAWNMKTFVEGWRVLKEMFSNCFFV